MTTTAPDGRVLAEFTVASEAGNERLALARVAAAVADVGLSDAQVERLKTAVAEATMNAIEHGNHYQAELAVELLVAQLDDGVAVSITDKGGDAAMGTPVELPDLDKKLVGLQSPRGWGLFLIRSMVDEMDVVTDGDRHTVRLEMRAAQPSQPGQPQGGQDAQQM